AHVYSVAPGRDLEQRLVRVRKSVTRVAWNGTRPIVAEAARAWSGGLDDQELDDDELARAREDALTLLTPRAFSDGEHGCVLEPDVAASILDVAVRALLTMDAVRRPEVARRLTASASSVSPAITLVDDPRSAHAYGGFEFDDAGVPAQAVTLIDKGMLVGRIGDGRSRRAGHVGVIEPAASHLRITAGTEAQEQLLADGFILEGALGAVVDPATDRLVVSVARARERASGRRTGRVFADVELVGTLASMLSAITAVSKETRTIGLRDEIDNQPRWRSIETPWLRTKALLRARRGAP
ncbi:MAG TPA: metallopeptidase TldD-related protein, partial [Kofleriaceae bacterium]|nr:metallopeptidase TldD-related protein [Kofleriaceae bacterium]